jgi:hypothetical protein
VKIGRIPLGVVLVLGLLALARLGWSGYNYVRAINAMNRIDVTVDATATSRTDHFSLQVQIHNDSSLPLTVQSLQLNLYSTLPDSIGATYDPFTPLRVAPHSTARVSRDLTIPSPDKPAAVASASWRLRGEALVRLPGTGHYFSYAISVPWKVNP